MFYAIPHFCTITQLSQKSKSARTTCWRAPLNLSSLSNHDPNVPSFFGYIYDNCLSSLAASLCESLKYELEKGLRSAYLLPCNGSAFFSSVGIFMACGIIHIQISENTIFQTLSEIINYVSFLYELYLDQGARWQVKFLRRK